MAKNGTRFEIAGIHKHSEEDIFKDGCQPDTGSASFIDETIEALTPEGCVESFRAFLGGVDADAVDLDSCEENGRVDISLMETEDGTAADEDDIAEWKVGAMRLWYVTYSGYMVKVTREPVTLSPAVRS